MESEILEGSTIFQHYLVARLLIEGNVKFSLIMVGQKYESKKAVEILKGGDVYKKVTQLISPQTFEGVAK